MKNLLCVARERHLRQEDRTLTSRVRMAVIYSLVLVTVAAVAWQVGSVIAMPFTDVQGNNKQHRAEDTTVSEARSLMERHDCWGREAPPDMRGQIPGGVVIRYRDKAPVYTESTVWVGKALDHVFRQDHPYREITNVYGFCRGEQ